jgi:hypothetical protein
VVPGSGVTVAQGVECLRLAVSGEGRTSEGDALLDLLSVRDLSAHDRATTDHARCNARGQQRVRALGRMSKENLIDPTPLQSKRASGWWLTYMLPDSRGEKYKGRVSARSRKRGAPPGWLPRGTPDPNADPWIVRGITRKQWENCRDLFADGDLHLMNLRTP